MFSPHLQKLEIIKKNLNQGKYTDAETNIQRHLKVAFKGTGILTNLKTPIVEYEKSLRNIFADLEDLKNPNVPNKKFLRKKCLGELELARQQLHSLHEYLEQITNHYFRK